ncbi:hypothetical protein B0H14DRAFT_80940 [Mycena olivaceomarginata]|nr:hypothetical protein B0H14DRAFT_80940 [Mycena olivaceomarginata]
MQYGTVRSTAPLENKNMGCSLYLGLLRGGRGVPCFLGSHRHVYEQFPRPPLEHSGKSLGYFYASTVLLHDNRNYSVLFNPNNRPSRAFDCAAAMYDIPRQPVLFARVLVLEVLDPNRIKTKVQLYKEEPGQRLFTNLPTPSPFNRHDPAT